VSLGSPFLRVVGNPRNNGIKEGMKHEATYLDNVLYMYMIDFDIRGMGLVWGFSSADKVEPNEATMQCGCVQTCGIPYTPKWPNGKEDNVNH
jgi:hypothetical protein